jgi:hypothetical protein
MAVERVADLDLAQLRQKSFFPSPASWEDEVLYFLMLGRFSDGNEDGYRGNDASVMAGSTPIFGPGDEGNAILTDADAAHVAGGRWELGGRHA